ncbi:MAG TPA: hypothetical protein VL095_04620 [Flavisolibacter sp.]|nr:hypothetical protein [Flavisolibacter sp.]
MKTFKIIAICAVVSLGFLQSGAQEKLHANEKLPINQPNYNKPKIFDDLPRKMNLKISDMESLFDLSVGTAVTAKLTQDFHFKGTVVSKAGNSESQVRSVVINSTNRKGAVFTFSRVVKEDGSFIYRGRILNKESIDAYEIVKENDQYVLVKKNYYEIVRE